MIPGIPSLGGVELLILLAIVLLFFGAKRLPQLAWAIGGGVRELREELTGADNEDEVQVRSRQVEKPSQNRAIGSETSHLQEEDESTVPSASLGA
jgi:TatA/E family protein of Tat protein translocase